MDLSMQRECIGDQFGKSCQPVSIMLKLSVLIEGALGLGWLAVPLLTICDYWPNDEILDGGWSPPGVKIAQ